MAVTAPDTPVDPAPAAPGGPMRPLAHLDMDAFFASLELPPPPRRPGRADAPHCASGHGCVFRLGGTAALPAARGPARGDWRRAAQGGRAAAAKPGWLGAARPAPFPGGRVLAGLRDYVGRGVITTATYAARQFGVGSAMGMMKGAKLCPQAIVLPVDFDEVRKYSRLFKSVITEIAPVMQDRGVDEVYIDFTDVRGGQREGGRVLARLIQKSIADATGLTCSIGVAPNRLLAKMASEFNKPNGITIIYEQDLQTKIWPLDVRKINGIGPKAGQKLAALGVQRIGELAAQDPQWLMARFGKSIGAWMHRAAWGQDDSPVVTESEPVSMSRETTFERDLHAVHDKAELGRIFTDLCMRLAEDLQRKGYVARTIGIKL